MPHRNYIDEHMISRPVVAWIVENKRAVPVTFEDGDFGDDDVVRAFV